VTACIALQRVAAQMTAFLKRQGSVDAIDDDLLQTVGVKKKKVRSKLLERLSGVHHIVYETSDYPDDFEGAGADDEEEPGRRSAVVGNANPAAIWPEGLARTPPQPVSVPGRDSERDPPGRGGLGMGMGVGLPGVISPTSSSAGGSSTKLSQPPSPTPVASPGGSGSEAKAPPPPPAVSLSPTTARGPGGGGGRPAPIKGNSLRSPASRKLAEELDSRLRGAEANGPPTPSGSRTPGGSRAIRRWRLGSKIGGGAFGTVYMGLNEETGQLMAVKVLNISGQEQEAQDLYKEIDLMRKLDHPNIVRYLGAQVNVNDGKVYIFQDWVAGGSISDLLTKFGPLSVTTVRKYTVELLTGLVYLHANGIIHRDIKGQNLLVDDKGVVKLADFGASKDLGMQASTEQLAQTLKGSKYPMIGAQTG
jgi:hypothetical protein